MTHIPRPDRAALRLMVLGLCVLLGACGWLRGSDRGGGDGWTCSNLSPIAQQYMRASSAAALNCGPGGAPVRASGY